MSKLISRIVSSARQLHSKNKTIDSLWLSRYNEDINRNKYDVISDCKSSLSKQIADISDAEKLYGNSGSNTHLSIFAKSNTKTEWIQRGNFLETDRNQLICDLVKTFNLYKNR